MIRLSSSTEIIYKDGLLFLYFNKELHELFTHEKLPKAGTINLPVAGHFLQKLW